MPLRVRERDARNPRRDDRRRRRARPPAAPSSCQKATSDSPSAADHRRARHAAGHAARERTDADQAVDGGAEPAEERNQPDISHVESATFNRRSGDRDRRSNWAIVDRRSRSRSPDLPPHQVHLVDVDRLLVAVEREDDPETDRRFGGGDGDDENREHLADGVLQLRPRTQSG